MVVSDQSTKCRQYSWYRRYGHAGVNYVLARIRSFRGLNGSHPNVQDVVVDHHIFQGQRPIALLKHRGGESADFASTRGRPDGCREGGCGSKHHFLLR